MSVRYALFVGIILSLSGLLAACGKPAAPTPAPAIAALPNQPTPAASATPSSAPSPTEAPTATPPATPTEVPTPTPPATATPAPSPTPAPTEAPKPTAEVKKEAVQVPESVWPRYGVFKGPLKDQAGQDAGWMVLVRLPSETPDKDSYLKCMWMKDTKDKSGWAGCGLFVLGKVGDGTYLQIAPPARKLTKLVFGANMVVNGSVVRPMGKVGVDELTFSLTGFGGQQNVLAGYESTVVAIREGFNKGFREDAYSNEYIAKFLKDRDISLPKPK